MLIWQRRQKIFLSLFLFLFLLQIFFCLKISNIRSNIDIIPELPNESLLEIYSLGDKEFYFRFLAMKVQNFGDMLGSFSSLKNYDYAKLYKWFEILDLLNSNSTIIPSLVSYYFSYTKSPTNLSYLITYLEKYASRDIDQKWWWMFQAVMMAKYSLQDVELAMNLANKLSQAQGDDVELWVAKMPQLIARDIDNNCLAFKITQNILQESQAGKIKVNAKNLDFMRHFIKKTIKKLNKENFNPNEC